LGNFIGFMVSIHLMRRGNKYTALTGGATGMIGDPGGKDAERTFLSEEALNDNQKAIEKQISDVLKVLESFTGDSFKYDFVNNKDFYCDMGYLDFLREVGKYITINVMMSKDTVKKRIEDPKQSISYTEFSYMLLQGYDFAKMYKDMDMMLQIGGQDQWGNLVTGTEIIRKKYDGESYALTWPLITDSTGKKFGKSEGNAMFLDKNKTSPYFIYQYFMNTADSDISKYLKMLTLLETEDIDEVVSTHMLSPEKREGQKILAFKVVEIIHGKQEANIAVKITEFMFGNNDKLDTLKNLSSDELNTFQNAMGGFEYNGENFFETIVTSGLAKSNGEARNSVKSGAIYINEEKVTDFNFDVNSSFINNKVLFIKKGKKNQRIVIKK
ncbi:tyrosine--tRNA ligase, partial [Candidatus Gracilibacteria bacterium]|nr:tyrosine--tRNA ligase [Candidatus Gracilibacteria bacterium]